MRGRSGACVAGACMAGEHAWWGACHGMCAWQVACMLGGACMVEGMHGGGACVGGETATAVDSTQPTGMYCCSNI